MPETLQGPTEKRCRFYRFATFWKRFSEAFRSVFGEPMSSRRTHAETSGSLGLRAANARGRGRQVRGRTTGERGRTRDETSRHEAVSQEGTVNLDKVADDIDDASLETLIKRAKSEQQ